MKKILAGLLLAGTATVAQAQSFNTVGTGNTLVTSTVAAPGTNTSSRAVTGLAAGDTLVGIDYRPAERRTLYAISQTGRVYAVNPNTAVATQIGSPGFTPTGTVGFDFNPSVDRIRVVTSSGQNVRLNPTVTGTTSTLAGTDGAIRYADGTTATPTLAGAAYTNNVAGGTPTTMYAIDTRGGTGNAVLVTQGTANSVVSPNTGQLYAVGSTGVTTTGNVGFDIQTTGTNNTAYATMTSAAGVTSLYSVNLTTGQATLIGALAGNGTYNGLALALAPFQSFGATANQAAVGGALDAFTGVPSANVNGIFNAIDSLSAGAAQADALSQLSPAAYTLLPDVSLNAVEAQETNILRYLRDLRGNAVTPDGERVTVDDAGRVGMFVLGGARFGSFDADVDRPQVDNDEHHVMGGIDFRLTEKTLIGAFGGYSNSDVRFGRGAPTSDLRSWFAGAYGTVGVGPFYIDAFGSYTDLDWTLNRTASFGGFTGNTLAETDGRVWAAGGSTGLSFSLGRFEVEPFAAIRYADVKIDGFTETGAANALTVSDIEDESLRLNLGGRLGTKFDAMGAVVRVQARGGWMREFLMNDSRVMTVAFTEPGITSPFSFTTNPLSAEYYNAGAALNIAGNGPFSVVADYDVQFDDDRQFHALTVGGRLAF